MTAQAHSAASLSTHDIQNTGFNGSLLTGQQALGSWLPLRSTLFCRVLNNVQLGRHVILCIIMYLYHCVSSLLCISVGSPSLCIKCIMVYLVHSCSSMWIPFVKVR